MNSKSPREAARAGFLWLLGGAMALAQTNLEVRPPSAKLAETIPGGIVTVSVVVANRGAEPAECIDRLTLPAGCQRVAPPELPFRVEAGGQTVRVLAVAVPATMPAGRCEVRYTALSRRDFSTSGSVAFAIVVASVDGLDFALDPGPATIIAGDAFTLHGRVSNHGNSALGVQLAAKSDLGFKIHFENAGFPLPAGATREIVCQVESDRDFARHVSCSVRFIATAIGVAGKVVSARQAALVEVIPQVSGSRDPFHYFPMQLRLIGLAESDHAPQFQTELSGEGSLDEAGRHRVDFILRGPDVQNSSLFGERDEYGASYHDANWDVDLGDRSFALSPLTERQNFGRGAGVRWHDGPTSAGAFYMSTRFRTENTEEAGAFVRRELPNGFSVQTSFLHKSGGDQIFAEALPQNIAALETTYRFRKVVELRVEAGVSRSDQGVTDAAWRAEAHGELPGQVIYSVEHAHAGPNFHGYYSADDTTYASVLKAITPKFRVHAELTNYAGNLATNDIRSSVVNREQSWNIGSDYAVTKASEVSLEWRHVQRADILLPASYDFTEDSARLGASHNFGKVRLQSFIDLGTLDNALTDQGGPFQRYSLNATWQPTAHQTYSAFASYGPSSFTGAEDKQLSAGVSARWQVSEHFNADLSYTRNQYDGLIGREQDQALAALRYEFANKSSLSFIGRWSKAGSNDKSASVGNESAVMVAYTIPFNLGVSRKRSIGVLQGRLSDPTRTTGDGVQRAILRVGEQFAVTDENGCFEFPSLKPGNYEITVLPDSLGPHLAMKTLLPMKATVHPAETTHVTLLATPACSLTIQVTRFEFTGGQGLNATGELREAGGQDAVTVEITNGRDVWRAQTDRLGHAGFDRLAAGRWTLRAASRELPPLCSLENPERSLDLAPGHSQQVALRVLPQRRTLRLLDQGTIR